MLKWIFNNKSNQAKQLENKINIKYNQIIPLNVSEFKIRKIHRIFMLLS